MESAFGTGLGLVIGLLIVAAVGAVAGWLASIIVKGSGLGLVGDILLGIGGALLAGYVLPLFGVSIGGWFGIIAAATIGAVVILLIIRLLRRA